MGHSSSKPKPDFAFQQALKKAIPDTSLLSFPQDKDFPAKVKVYNLDDPVVPAAIVRPKTTEQVSAAVKCAAAAGVKVQPKCGGHSFANYCLGGTNGALVIDMVNFQKFEMDRKTWKATVGGGTLLKDITKRMHDAGHRAIAHGTCPQVGIGGHATIGGLGPLSRQWGASLDHIREVEVVIADGSIVRANEAQHSDLYFAIRGAAASFGVVTEFVFQTRPEPPSCVHYSFTFEVGDWESKAKTFAKWQAFVADPNLDRKFAAQLIVTPVAIIITGTYFGSRQEFDDLKLEAKLGGRPKTSIDTFENWVATVLNWAQQEAINFSGGIPAAFYSKNLAFKTGNLIPENGINFLFKYIHEANKGTLIWFVIFDLQGGATNDVPLEESAYAHRDTLYYLQSYAIGHDKVSKTTHNFLEGINNVVQKSMPLVDFGAYAGYVDPYLPDGQKHYWQSNYPRLQQIKAEYDPQNVFANPQSVRLPSLSK
ncbi:hypothetical protein CVT26_008097 [Gymnopilus dilepis]|uniref:FAD-binding PCMH-type domain-containing protein n=1 Tax=Gymnopilus dilepis TaxID=231916 RepID=A0A409WFA9_9AGAR|nr:hypothetical protein CVT26_008097 [Gymnopilus dilepis]